MRPLILLLAVLGATACGGAGRGGAPPAADSTTVARARAAADSLGRDLMGLLLGELDRGGPEAAVAVCADSAQARTVRHAREGLTVRRVGTRVRNPRNAPDTLEARLLAYFAAEQAAGRPLQEVTEVGGAGDGWELRLVRPITLLERCTTCHGQREQIPPAARALIEARYPEDRATGYAPGELRGAVSVRVALPPAR